MGRITCHHCTTRVFGVLAEHDPDNCVYWPSHREALSEGNGYTIARRRFHSGKLVGRKPTIAYYAHLPLQDPKYVNKMHGMMEKDERCLKREMYSILIYPHDTDLTWAMEHDKLFDEVWVLDKQVSLGASGPYPSVRAERSILRTLEPFRLHSVMHYWPAAALEKKDCRMLAETPELLKDWALFNRTRLPIKVGQ